MARRRSRADANIWPGFVDALSTLLLVMMFVLSIFVVAQFFLGDKLATVKQELSDKDSELARLIAQINSINDELGLEKQKNAQLAADILALNDTIDEKNDELAGLTAALATSAAAVAASADELDAERALSDEQKSQIATLNAQIAALRKQLASLQEALDAAEVKDLEQQSQIENLSTRLNAALSRKVLELQEVRSRFFEALRDALGDRADVKVVGDRFIFESDILFGSCSSTLGEAGKVELRKLGAALIDIQNDLPSDLAWVLRVDGHADAARLGPGCRQFFDSNLELSAQRAISVVEFLTSNGVPARRLLATGAGSTYPLVSGSSSASLAQNRRIEFKLTER